ncbi:MAG: hypothetical protein ACYTFX_06315 [Planctomycetota bacterium]
MDNIHPNLSLEFRGQVVIATLTDEKILDEDQLQGLEGSFLPLIDQTPGIQLIINFQNVKKSSKSFASPGWTRFSILMPVWMTP